MELKCEICLGLVSEIERVWLNFEISTIILIISIQSTSLRKQTQQMSEFSSKDPPTKPFKSATMRVSVNSKTLSRKNSSSKLEISNNITKDIDSLTLFIESLSAWLSEYYFSGTSLSLSHFPRVPILDYMQDIAPSLNQFRSILGIVRETTNTRISTLEAKMKQASSDKLIYSQTMGQIKTEIQKIKLKIEKRDEIILQIGLDKEKAEIESETKNKNIACFAQGFKKLKEEVEFLKDDIRIASSTVEYAIKEAQR